MSVCYVEFSKPIDNYTAVSSLSFGMAAGTLAGTGRQASPHDVSFSMNVNSMSRRIWQACMDGTAFSAVWVEYYRNEDSDEPYMLYTLSDVVVASVSTHGNTMNVGLIFTKAKGELVR